MPGLSYPRTRPARISAWACARLSANPCSTRSTSSRFFTSRRARGETVDDVLQHGGVRRYFGEPCTGAFGGLVSEAPRSFGSMREDVAVAVEDVVDDLEQQSELVPESPPRRLLPLGDLGDPQREPDRRREEAARLQLVQRRFVRCRAGDVEVLPADHAESRLRELATDMRERKRERETEGLRKQRVACEHRGGFTELCPDRRPAAPLRVVVQRRQIIVDERECVHELECRAGRQSTLRFALCRLSGRQTDDAAYALAADKRVANRLG